MGSALDPLQELGLAKSHGALPELHAPRELPVCFESVKSAAAQARAGQNFGDSNKSISHVTLLCRGAPR